MRDLLMTAITGRDNRSVDIGRVLWAATVAGLVALETHAIAWLHQPFDPMAFANACGVLLAAGGAALGVKAHTEPPQQ